MEVYFMRITTIALVLILILLTTIGCAKDNTLVETNSTIIRKDIIGDNQYYFYVEYKIEGHEGTYEATIKLPNKKIYDSYKVGDTYVFERPVPKN